jgi:hypothetical protein
MDGCNLPMQVSLSREDLRHLIAHQAARDVPRGSAVVGVPRVALRSVGRAALTVQKGNYRPREVLSVTAHN